MGGMLNLRWGIGHVHIPPKFIYSNLMWLYVELGPLVGDQVMKVGPSRMGLVSLENRP